MILSISHRLTKLEKSIKSPSKKGMQFLWLDTNTDPDQAIRQYIEEYPETEGSSFFLFHWKGASELDSQQ
jgi:hypothetical protein